MSDAPWSRRLADIRTDGWQLESGEARHLQHGDNFWIPPVAERHGLQPGQAVKLLFEIEAEDGDGPTKLNVERMWAIVLGRVGALYLGVLDSQPASIEPGYLDKGAEFLFKPEHVIDIDDPPREYLIEKYGDRLKLPPI